MVAALNKIDSGFQLTSVQEDRLPEGRLEGRKVVVFPKDGFKSGAPGSPEGMKALIYMIMGLFALALGVLGVIEYACTLGQSHIIFSLIAAMMKSV